MSDVSATDLAGEAAGDAGAGAEGTGGQATESGPETGAPVGADLTPAAAAAATPAAPVGGFAGPPSGGGLEKLVNVSLNVSVELGRTRVSLAEVLDYDVGSVVELDRAAGAPVDVRVNDTLLAQGEVVLIDDEYAVRITAIYDPNNPHQ